MAQDMTKLIDRLNDLIALDRDAVDAYASAIKRIDVVSIQERLREFQADHQRHIVDLSECVRSYGGEPRKRPDAKGFVLKAFTAITSMMGNRAALSAMKGNEQLTNKTYDKALEQSWPDAVQQIIVRNRDDERRHLAFIEEAIAGLAEDRETRPSV